MKTVKGFARNVRRTLSIAIVITRFCLIIFALCFCNCEDNLICPTWWGWSSTHSILTFYMRCAIINFLLALFQANIISQNHWTMSMWESGWKKIRRTYNASPFAIYRVERTGDRVDEFPAVESSGNYLTSQDNVSLSCDQSRHALHFRQRRCVKGLRCCAQVAQRSRWRNPARFRRSSPNI